MFPDFAGWWTPGAWTSRPLFGVPVGDLVTAALLCPAHALGLALWHGGRFRVR